MPIVRESNYNWKLEKLLSNNWIQQHTLSLFSSAPTTSKMNSCGPLLGCTMLLTTSPTWTKLRACTINMDLITDHKILDGTTKLLAYRWVRNLPTRNSHHIYNSKCLKLGTIKQVLWLSIIVMIYCVADRIKKLTYDFHSKIETENWI